MKGIPHDEIIWRIMANNGVYTNTLGEIVEVMRGRFCKIKLVSAPTKEFDLPLINVPVGRLIGTSQAVKVGMIIPVLFSKYALDKIFIDKEKKATLGVLEDLQFDRDNGFALPIVFDEKIDIEFPNVFTVHDEAKFESPVSMLDTLDVEKTITSLEDVIAQAVSLLNHIHDATKPGMAGVDYSGAPVNV